MKTGPSVRRSRSETPAREGPHAFGFAPNSLLNTIATGSPTTSSPRLRPEQLVEHHRDGVVEARNDAFLQGDDRVVRDLDVLGAHLRAALRDVAVADPHLVLDRGQTILDVEGMHLEPRRPHEEARTR